MDQDVLDRLSAVAEPAQRYEYGVNVELAGQTVRFLCDAPYGVRVAREILGPYCRVSELPADERHCAAPATPSAPLAAGDTWTVLSSVVEDLPALIEQLVRRAAAAGGSSARTTPVSIRRWAGDFAADRYDLGPGVSVVVHQRPFVGLTVFRRDERRISYLRPDAAFDVPHTEHVVKYPLRVTLRQAGFAQVHAAGCLLRGRGLLFMGEKGSGKSTLLTHCMSRGARQVSNDLSFVRADAGRGSEMVAFPHMTRVANGTIGDNKTLRDGLAREQRTGDYLLSPVFNGGKEEFYFPVLERIWGSEPVCRRTPLDVIVFPALEVDRTDTSSRLLPAAERDERVRESLVNDPPLPDWLPYLSDAEFRSLASAAADALLRDDPLAYELRFGPSETDPVGEIERILDGTAPARPAAG